MSLFFALDQMQLLYAAIALIGVWGLGLLLGIAGTAERMFAGLGVIAAISVPLLVTSPGAIRWIATTLVAVGMIGASLSIAQKVIPASSKWIENPSRTSLRIRVKSLSSRIWRQGVSHTCVGTLLASLILTGWLFPTFYIFESHDLIYFGWLPELFNGNDLAVNFATPMQMGAANSMPSLFLVPLVNPLTSPDFVDFIALRAWLVLIFTFLILRKVLGFARKAGASRTRLAGALALPLLMWGSEWAYMMLISSFVPAIALALITLSLLSANRAPNTVFLMFSLVAVAKAPIIAISLLTLVFLATSKIWKPTKGTFILSGLIIGVSIFTWVVSPKGVSSSDTAYSVMGLGYLETDFGSGISLSLYDWASSFTSLAGWLVDYPMSLLNSVMFSGSKALLITATAFSIIWLFTKYFLSYLFFRRLSFGNGSRNLGPLDVWAAGALFSTIFVRNGEEMELGHQAHSFILLSVPISILAVSSLLNQKSSKLVSARKNVFTVTFVTSLFLLSIVSPSNLLLQRASSHSATSLADALKEYSKTEISGGFIPSDVTNYSRLQVIAAITNSKLVYLQDANPPSQVDRFLIYPK
jgi:hypothetical protein